MCTSESVCVLAWVTWAGCPSCGGDLVAERGNFSIVLASGATDRSSPDR